jgi:hypothetical protein
MHARQERAVLNDGQREDEEAEAEEEGKKCRN